MIGYSPTLSVESKKEISSEVVDKFIEIGTVKHKEDCKCEQCLNEK